MKNRYNAGIDRLLAALQAIQLNDGSGPVITIDAGTAVTIDIVDSDGTFQGGVIFPGATTNLLQLSEAAPALPDLSDPKHIELLDGLSTNPTGDDTVPAIIKGVYQAQFSAFEAIVKSYRDKWNIPADSVYATGGGALQISDYLPSEWNIVPDLVLRSARNIGRLHILKQS